MSLNQAASPTTRTELGAVYNTEFISRRWRDTAQVPILGERLVKQVPIDGAEVYRYEVPILGEVSGVAAVAANDAAPEAAMSSSNVAITGQRYALRLFVHDGTRNKVMRTADQAMMRLQRAHRRFWHEQVLALFSNITNAGGGLVGSNTQENTLSNWDDATTAHRHQDYDGGQLWAVMAKDAVRDLRQDLIGSAASLFGTSWGERAHDALAANEPGVFRSFDGYDIYESDDVPAGDTTGHLNALGNVGEDAAIELVGWQGLQPELQRDASRFGTWIVSSMIAGVGIVAQHNLHGFITRPRP